MDLFFFYFYSIWLVSPAMKVHGVSYRHVTCKAFLKVKRVLNNFSAENVLVVDVQSQSYLHTYSKFLRSAFLLRFWSGSYPFVVVLVAAVKCHSLGLLTWYLVQWTKAICHRGDCCKFSWRTISSPCTMWNWIWGNYHATIQIRTRNEDSFSEKVVWNSLCKPKLNSVAVKTSGDSVEFRNNGEYIFLFLGPSLVDLYFAFPPISTALERLSSSRVDLLSVTAQCVPSVSRKCTIWNIDLIFLSLVMNFTNWRSW